MESIGTPDSRIGVNNLNKFVTRIWEHPLVTELTKKKREEAFQELNKLFKEMKNILLIPVGSIRWISGETSDVDFICVDMDGNVSEIQTIKSYLNSNHGYGSDNTRPVLHFAGSHSFTDKFNFEEEFDVIALFFITPDEYIIGDHDLLRILRLRALNQHNYIFNNTRLSFKEAFNNKLSQVLNNVKQWPIYFFGNHYSTKSLRFFESLARRAQLTRNPVKYTRQFYLGLTKLEPPDFDDMNSALHNSNGEIHIMDRYVAQDLS